MKLNLQQDIAAPIDFVFEQFTDFQSLERAAMRRGAEVQRVDNLPSLAPGMAWDARFKMRGKQRDVKIEITEIERPNRIIVSSRSNSMGGQMVVELLSLSRQRTRVISALVLQPKTLTAKLLVQSMKLARKNIERRLRDRTVGFAKTVEERYKKAG